jgi:hypothetical protein
VTTLLKKSKVSINTGTMKILVLLAAIFVSVRSKELQLDELLQAELHEPDYDHAKTMKIETPDVFGRRGRRRACHENGVVAGWCDAHINPALECAILPDFDEYGCSCLGDHALCPDDCVGGGEALVKTHFGIRCQGIPKDEPNYVLRESHAMNHCENNGVVASWCDDYINPHLTCELLVDKDQYACNCGHKAAACPTDCVGGLEPVEKTSSYVRCQGIPIDQPNYILKE